MKSVLVSKRRWPWLWRPILAYQLSPKTAHAVDATGTSQSELMSRLLPRRAVNSRVAARLAATRVVVALKAVGQAAAPMFRAPTIKGVRFQNEREIVQYFIFRLNDEHANVFLTMFLDSQGCVVAESVTRSIYSPSDVIRRCLRLNATIIIVAHKNPDGIVSPSLGDIILTKTLVEAADPMGIRVADYIIVGCELYFSFDQERLLIDPL